ncbi:hypothetical protein [uncultured Flavobacterium sp.]|uniref:GNAT family N-acetyltransferase n=1 Tax=uncultured Flavobacterium sp. TaxID=165435 RepID=UPI0025DC856E|nr:hypothetical protein [uncultured Flavobacterium sp.]
MSDLAYVSDSNWASPDLSAFLRDYRVEVWRPTLTNILPPGFPKKYMMFWFAHFLGVFRNKRYSVIYVYDRENGAMMSSTLLVPTYFKWPFMGKEDLQYSYSITKPQYRGKGINTYVKQYARVLYPQKEVAFWGLVHPENISSIKVLEKTGLHFLKGTRVSKYKLFPFIKKIELAD